MKNKILILLLLFPFLAFTQDYQLDPGFDDVNQQQVVANTNGSNVKVNAQQQPTQRVIFEPPTEAIAKSTGTVNVVSCKLDLNYDGRIDCVKNFYADAFIQADVNSCISAGYYPVVNITFYREVQYVNGIPVVGAVTSVDRQPVRF